MNSIKLTFDNKSSVLNEDPRKETPLGGVGGGGLGGGVGWGGVTK